MNQYYYLCDCPKIVYLSKAEIEIWDNQVHTDTIEKRWDNKHYNQELHEYFNYEMERVLDNLILKLNGNI